jgi:hypothetical protein
VATTTKKRTTKTGKKPPRSRKRPKSKDPGWRNINMQVSIELWRELEEERTEEEAKARAEGKLNYSMATLARKILAAHVAKRRRGSK